MKPGDAEKLLEKLDDLHIDMPSQVFAYLLLQISEHLAGIEFELERIADFFDQGDESS